MFLTSPEFFFFFNGKLEKQLVGFNPNTPVQLKQGAATLGNTIFYKLSG